MAARDLAIIERNKDRFGAGCAETKLVLLARLDRTRLRTPRQVERLHEALCFMRAYPGDPVVLAAVEHILERFAERADLRRHREALADSGIAGTTTRFRFFWPSALWLAGRWPGHLVLDRSDGDAEEAIARALPLLVTPAESAALRELDLPGYAAIDRLRGRRETDGAFLVRRVAAMPGDSFTREAFFDAIDASFELAPGADTPARTHARLAFAPFAFPDAPIRRGRPDLRAELRRPPLTVKRLSPRSGLQARRARPRGDGDPQPRHRRLRLRQPARRVARGRRRRPELHAERRRPERRAVVAATYGSLTLRNGVPIAYLQVDLAGRSAALSYHAFATFRGGEAAYTVARMLAMLHHVLGAGSFTLDPYQLGKGNDDGIESGAWWFYYKLGFRPRAAGVRRVMRGELDRLRANPRHRSSAAVLRRLAEGHLVFDVGSRRPVPLPPTAAIGLRVANRLAARGERGRHCRRRAAKLCGSSACARSTAGRRPSGSHGAAGARSSSPCWVCPAGARRTGARSSRSCGRREAGANSTTQRASTRTRCSGGHCSAAAEPARLRGPHFRIAYRSLDVDDLVADLEHPLEQA